MDKITIKDLEIYANHGVFPEENVLGQNSIAPTLTARGAGEEHAGMITYSDELDNTTNIQEELETFRIDPLLH